MYPIHNSDSFLYLLSQSPNIYKFEDEWLYGLGFSESFLMESHWLGEDGRNVCGVMEIASETGSATDMLEEIADDWGV